MKGAPLRFAAAVIGGWVIGRFVALTPVALPQQALGIQPVRAAEPRDDASPILIEPQAPLAVSNRTKGRGAQSARAKNVAATADAPLLIAAQMRQPDRHNAAPPVRAQETPPPERPVSPPLLPILTASAATPPRLAIDAWLVARPSGDSLAFGQLGGSQAGARLTYAVDRERRVALSARISTPLEGKGREAGLGIDLRPGAPPVHLLLEQRFALDGGGSRPAMTIVAGGSTALPGRVRVDAYAQGGAVWRRGGFADGAAVASRTAAERDAVRLEIGAGLWGAAQRRAERLDLGPSAALIAPVGGKAVRLQLDYRVRVAGRARPGSGPALTLGGSF